MTPKSDLELAEKHRYRLPNGDLAVSVTGVLHLLDDDSKSSKMAGAAARIAREGGNYRQEWAAKRDRGTRVHQNCEAWLRGRDAEVQAKDSGFMDALSLFFDQCNPTPLEIERVVVSDKGYGGRFDMIVTFPDSSVWLVDVKTGRKYFVEHSCQLAAYANADGMAVFGKDGNLAAVEPLPQIDRAGCLYLSEDGTYELTEYPIGETSLTIFHNLLEIHGALRALKAEDAA